MSTALKLKEHLQTNIPMILTIKKRSGPYPSKYHENEEQWLYIFSKDGKEYSHYASSLQQKVLEDFREGEQVQVVRTEKIDGTTRKTFYNWTDVAGAEARSAATPQLHSNTAATRMENQQETYEKKAELKEIQISLAGIMQAHISTGKSNEDALKEAIAGRRLLIKATHDEYEFGF